MGYAEIVEGAERERDHRAQKLRRQSTTGSNSKCCTAAGDSFMSVYSRKCVVLCCVVFNCETRQQGNENEIQIEVVQIVMR